MEKRRQYITFISLIFVTIAFFYGYLGIGSKFTDDTTKKQTGPAYRFSFLDSLTSRFGLASAIEATNVNIPGSYSGMYRTQDGLVSEGDNPNIVATRVDIDSSSSWVWNLTISLPSPKTILGIKITSPDGSWSTSDIDAQPLLVYKNGDPLSPNPEGQLDTVKNGVYTYEVLGTKESNAYKPSTITVLFDQGDSLVVTVP